MTNEEEKIYNHAIYDVMDYLGDFYTSQGSSLSRSDELENDNIYAMVQDIGDTLLKNPDINMPIRNLEDL